VTLSREFPAVERQTMSEQIKRFFGGPPLSVAVRLILLSILAGVILSALGLDPLNLWRSLQNLVRQIWDMGFDAIWWLWRYFLIGAVLVIPIWVIMRLAKTTSGRTSRSE
jgi:Family of unknown function (DUF6460)